MNSNEGIEMNELPWISMNWNERIETTELNLTNEMNT